MVAGQTGTADAYCDTALESMNHRFTSSQLTVSLVCQSVSQSVCGYKLQSTSSLTPPLIADVVLSNNSIKSIDTAKAR